MMTAAISASTPFTAIPTIRNGNSSSHTMGYINNANNAKGQQKKSSRHQIRKLNIATRITRTDGKSS